MTAGTTSGSMGAEVLGAGSVVATGVVAVGGGGVIGAAAWCPLEQPAAPITKITTTMRTRTLNRSGGIHRTIRGARLDRAPERATGWSLRSGGRGRASADPPIAAR